MRILSSLAVLVSFLGLIAVGCSESPQEIELQTQATRSGESISPLFSVLGGTESLGDIGIPIPPASGVVIGGVGLVGDPATAQPGDIEVTVPGTPVKSFLYWCGHNATDGTDLDITLNGSPLSGDLIGGPTLFFGGAWSSTVRADISDMGIIVAGYNMITVGGLDFTTECLANCQNLGVGLLVVYDDGTVADIQIKDGNDNAFYGFAPPLDTTVPVTYAFTPAAELRTASLCMFAGSVAQFPSEGGRPNVVDISFDVGAPIRLVDVFQGNEGDDFDAVCVSVDIPAGASSMTVQAKSEKDPSSSFTGLPASFNWLVSVAVIPPPDEQEGFGCRMTGGLNEIVKGDDTGNSYTCGGQAGAPTALQPQPWGEWTHHNKNGPDGAFVFHAGTASAPPGTEIDWIECMDEGWCVQARPAPAKQIDFAGVGTFKNIKPNVPWKDKVVVGDSFHWFEVNVDDLGEPGRAGKVDPPLDICPADGFGRNAATELADCMCPDYYRITIHEGPTDASPILYTVEGYIRGGNLQIHPLTGNDTN